MAVKEHRIYEILWTFKFVCRSFTTHNMTFYKRLHADPLLDIAGLILDRMDVLDSCQLRMQRNTSSDQS